MVRPVWAENWTDEVYAFLRSSDAYLVNLDPMAAEISYTSFSVSRSLGNVDLSGVFMADKIVSIVEVERDD